MSIREPVKAAAVPTRTLDPCDSDSERFDETRTGEIDWVGVDVGSWVIRPESYTGAASNAVFPLRFRDVCCDG
jgi:hypothetical protein